MLLLPQEKLLNSRYSASDKAVRLKGGGGMAVIFVKPEEKYIRSYWETFGEICREKIYLALSEPFSYERTVEFITKIIEAGMPSLFVIDIESGRCVGWCDALSDDGVSGRVGMGILKPFRDRKIGTDLLRQIILLSSEYGYENLKLDVWKSNKRAIHTYEKSGFVKYDEDDKKICMVLKLKK